MTNLVFIGIFTAYSYCGCKVCCTAQNGVTASGTVPVEGRTVGGTGNVPYGTKLYIEGVGVRIMEDRMARRIKGNKIDVYVDNHKKAKKLGVKRVRVWKVG
jgi:3D (Asp-Asp-Asp) domain-containing protein